MIVAERIIVDLIGAVIKGSGPLKFLRHLGLQNLEGLTFLTRFAYSLNDLIAGFIPRFTKELDETTVGKTDPMILVLQVNKNGQAVQQGIELFPFDRQGDLRLFTLGGIANGPQQCVALRCPFDQIVLGPLAHRAEGQGFVGQASQDHESTP